MAFHPVDFEEKVMILERFNCRLIKLPQLGILEH